MRSTLNEIERGNVSVTLVKWCQMKGITPVTAWRWRRNGWLRTVNIAGRQYVTPEAQEEFERRAEAGEFARAHNVPPNNAA